MYLRNMNNILILLFILPIHLLSQSQTVTFQDGIDGYDGTTDTYINSANPDISYSSSSALLWDGDPDVFTTLIQFNNIFVSQDGPVPNNSYIVSATLTYYVYNSGAEATVHEVLSAWDNSLTWNQFNFTNDIGNFIGTAQSDMVGTYESIDVTSSLSSWSSNSSSNHGWIIQSLGTNGSDVYSSDWGTITQRPKLTVVYLNSTPPNQPSLVSPTDGSTDITRSPSLVVNVTDPDNDNLDVHFFARVKIPSVESNFTLIGIPDTQHYTDVINNNQYFYDQTDWIVANKDALNIVYISQFGDCVENDDAFDSEWQVVNTAWMTVEDPITTGLVDGIPYGLNVGNHDISSSGQTLKYNEYFGFSRFQGRVYYGGHYGSNNNNHYELFSAGGMDFIVLNFEYDSTPAHAVLEWGDNLLKTYSNRRAIVVSHYLIEADNDPNPEGFGIQGQIIYDNLKDNPNLFLMLCGHRLTEGRRSDVFNGNTIHTLLADYQGRPNGGNGWLRIMEFRPPENKIYVSTYSPSLDQYETDSNSEFVLDYNMGVEPFQEIASVNNVVSGSNASFVWSSLLPETEYEWYVEVFDGSGTITGPIWTFTTGSGDISLAEVKIFLEGPYSASGDSMRTDLMDNGFIPLTSPYSEDPRVVSSIPQDITDWVLVELRETATGPAVTSKSVFLRNDGRIVSDDGFTPTISMDVAANPYYIVIKHRNHLDVMSANAVQLSNSSSTLYDFSTGSGQYYGNDAKLLKTGVFGSYRGDANANTFINATDYLFVKDKIGFNGYYLEDCNLNGFVNATDYLFIKTNIGKSSQVD